MNFSLKKFYLIILFIELILVVFIGLLFQTLNITTNSLYSAQLNRFNMIRLAEELKNSSDDLTRFAREYVVTNNIKYKDNYFEILNIRDGKSKRPLNYHHPYWNLLEPYRSEKHPKKETISFKELIKSLELLEKEHLMLLKSEQNSNDLVNLEVEAFNAIEGKFKDSNGNYTIKKEPDREYAIKLLYSKEYRIAKHKIMKPIDEFFESIDKRTENSVKKFNEKKNLIFIYIFISFFIFLLINIFIFTALIRKTLYPISYLTNAIQNYRKGSTLEPKKEFYNDETKVLINSFFDMKQSIEEQNKKLNNLVIQNTKMAEMGEMIGAIAHQWKQPLNVLSLMIQNVVFKYERGHLNDEDIRKMKEKGKYQINFMSQTIDDFRNFLKPSKNKEEFLACESISETYRLLEAKIKTHNIIFNVNKHKHFKIFGQPNEFKQAILNIINNSVDVFEERSIENREINVVITNDGKIGTISIEDNGGGIVDGLLPNEIFNPYITTKGENGTGIGLNISKNIIEKSMNGSIVAKNSNKGAIFEIKLPISSLEEE